MLDFYRKYERHITTVAFLGGIVFDSLTLPRIDQLFGNLILIGHLVIIFSGIVLYTAFGYGKTESFFGKIFGKFVSIFPSIIQFSFGAVLSGTLVFYFRFSSISTAWPFLLALGLVAISNEIFRSRYNLFGFQLSAFFFAVFAYTSYAVPVLLRSLGDWIFISSGLISLSVVFFLIIAVNQISPDILRRSRTSILFGVAGLYVLLNFFYFANLIPPLPLSLKEAGVYHNLEKDNAGNYILTYEKAPWYSIKKESSTFHVFPGENVYLFSSVFAPPGLDLTLSHEWFLKNESSGNWEKRSSVSFPISGGREEGYRGYSVKENISPGKWKVNVETDTGRIIGRVSFKVKPAKELVTLEKRVE